jgi:SDR family mycofactocin-dependent oxidoreductase
MDPTRKAIMGRVQNKVALITGGARGQGAAHAVKLASEGADVVIVDSLGKVGSIEYELASQEDLDAVVAAVESFDRRAVTVKGDVRSQGDMDTAVSTALAELGKIDILVANAGIFTMQPFWEMSEETWQDTIDINLTGVWHAAKAVAPHMIERKEGAIVMIGSTCSSEGMATNSHYAAAKHGVVGLMKSAALELGPHNIRCNAILPGFIDTKIHHWQGAYDMMAGHEGGTAADRTEASYFYGVLSERAALAPSVVSDTVIWLVSDESKDITGIQVPVDAGHLILPGFNPSSTRAGSGPASMA